MNNFRKEEIYYKGPRAVQVIKDDRVEDPGGGYSDRNEAFYNR